MGKQRVNKERTATVRRRTVAVLGLCLVALVQLLTVKSNELDIPLTVALSCFAVAIPLLTARIVILEIEEELEYTQLFWYETMFIVAILPAFAGVAAGFWHFDWWLGAIFLVSSVVAMATVAHFQSVIEELNRKPNPGAQPGTPPHAQQEPHDERNRTQEPGVR
ncbi:MAG TPA: hypothetical protein VD866_19900 [Urbifossiella sp.]|nr:hypothetical protein [Urbifossiella sp.]